MLKNGHDMWTPLVRIYCVQRKLAYKLPLLVFIRCEWIWSSLNNMKGIVYNPCASKDRLSFDHHFIVHDLLI